MHRLARTSLGPVLCLLAGCPNNNNNRPTPVADAGRPAVVSEDSGPAVPSSRVVDAPRNTLVTLRGSALRKILNFIAPGAPAGVVLGQLAPQLTPGIGEHGIDIDADSSFAAAMFAPPEGPDAPAHGSLALVVAWPLRSGMQVAQDALAHRNYRDVSPGIYEPTTAPTGDAGSGDNTCWVARRQPVGWMMLCGQREALRTAAAYLVNAGTTAPTPNTVVDLTVRPEPARRLFALQLAALEAQDPRHSDAGANTANTRAEYDEVHRGLENTKILADDLSALHGTLTVDQDNYRMHVEAEFSQATGSSSRALIGSAVGRHAATELLALLPQNANAWLAMGFDMHALMPLLAPTHIDPQIVAQLGPEMGRLQEAVHAVTDFRGSGDRVVGFTDEEGGTTIQIARLEDPAGAVNTLRTATAAVPRTPRPSGQNPANYFAIMPAVGMPAGSLRLRLGPDPAQLPPNAPADLRRFYQRSVLFVPQQGHLQIIEALDPVARFRAASTGAHLQAEVPADRVAAMRLSPAALGSILGIPREGTEAPSNDPIRGTIQATRLGDSGARFVADADAPITAVNQVRDMIARVQAAQDEAAQRARQAAAAARAAAQGHGPGPGGPGGPGRPGGRGQLVLPGGPGGGGGGLPDPDFQLRPPGQ